jgi:hypothetical protein
MPGTGTQQERLMNVRRVGLHSLALVLADFAGILGGFLAYKAFDFNQILIQLPVAFTLSILLFLAWFIALRAFGCKQLLLPDLKELLLVFVFSVVLALVIFVPLHFFTQGYLTASRNLALLALYQMPVNLIALCIVWITQN